MGGGRESSQINRITFQPSRSNTPLTSWAWKRHCILGTFKGANLAFPNPLMHPSVHALTVHPCTDSLGFTHSFTALSADSFKNRLTSPPVFSFPGSLIYVTVHPPVQLIQLPGIRSCAGDLDLGNSELQHSEGEVRCGQRGLLRTLHPSPGLMLRDRELLSAVSDAPREAWLRTPRCTSNTKAPACLLMEA